jgi:hypothetical protein
MFISHVEGAAADGRGGKDECGYQVHVRFQLRRWRLDSGAGDFVRSLTHTFASRESEIGWGFAQFATCEVCLLLFLFISAKKLNSFT